MNEADVKSDFTNFNLESMYIKDRNRGNPEERVRALTLLGIRAPYPVALLLEARKHSSDKETGYIW